MKNRLLGTSLVLGIGAGIVGCTNTPAPLVSRTTSATTVASTGAEPIPAPSPADILRVGKTGDVKAALTAQKGRVVIIDFWATY